METPPWYKPHNCPGIQLSAAFNISFLKCWKLSLQSCEVFPNSLLLFKIYLLPARTQISEWYCKFNSLYIKKDAKHPHAVLAEDFYIFAAKELSLH